MAELTKTDSRQPVGKVKPTDEMVMMPGLFDGTKPENSMQHYERFNVCKFSNHEWSFYRPCWRGYRPFQTYLRQDSSCMVLDKQIKI